MRNSFGVNLEGALTYLILWKIVGKAIMINGLHGAIIKEGRIESIADWIEYTVILLFFHS